MGAREVKQRPGYCDANNALALLEHRRLTSKLIELDNMEMVHYHHLQTLQTLGSYNLSVNKTDSKLNF